MSEPPEPPALAPKSLGSNLGTGIGIIAIAGAIICIFNFRPAGSDESAINKQVLEAKSLLYHEDYAGAEHLLRDLTRVSPRRSDVRCLLAQALYKQKRLPESLQELQQVLRDDPRYQEAQEAKAAIQEQLRSHL